MSIHYGVQSYCFRSSKDNAEVASMVKEIGLSSIEVCGVHADFSDPEGFAKEVATYQAAGVDIISIGVETFCGRDEERVRFESAAKAGCKHISAHFRIDTFMEAVPKVRRWCQEFDMRVGIHCHGGYMFGGSPDEIEYLMSLGGPEIGLCIDTAWCMQIGPNQGKPVEWVKRFGDRLYGVHFKDFLFESNGQWKDVVVGTGNLDLPAFAKALEEGGFDGMAVIEYEGDIDNPVPSLKACVESMRASIG